MSCGLGVINVRLAVMLILRGELDGLVGSLACVCSSYVPVNSGTSKRDLLCAMGDDNVVSVRKSNKMTSRWDVRTTFLSPPWFYACACLLYIHACMYIYIHVHIQLHACIYMYIYIHIELPYILCKSPEGHAS